MRHPLFTLLLVILLGACGGGGSPADEAAAASPAMSEGEPDDDRAQALATSLVPMAPLASYTVLAGELLRNPRFDLRLESWGAVTGQATIAASERRSGGLALRATGVVTQNFDAALLEPGRAYTLRVMARMLGAGSAAIAVRFREGGNGSFRTYDCRVTGTTYRECRVDFTAPAYALRGALTLTPSGGTLVADSASLVMRSAIVHTEPVTTLVGSTVPAGYSLVFNDEFTGTTLRRPKWFTRYINTNETQDRLNDEQQRYRDNNNHVLADGILRLTARKVSSDDPSGINYESGLIRSDFTFRYGYVEARVRMPGGRGVWPALWLVSDVDTQGAITWPPEIDIFEVVNNGREDTMDMLHTGVIVPSGTAPASVLYADSAFNTTWTYWRAPYRFDEGWHTVAVEWTPESVTTFVDGRRIVTRAYPWTRPDGAPAGSAHLLINLAVGGSWAGRHGIDDSAFPQSLQVNWVRVYQKSNSL